MISYTKNYRLNTQKATAITTGSTNQYHIYFAVDWRHHRGLDPSYAFLTYTDSFKLACKRSEYAIEIYNEI